MRSIIKPGELDEMLIVRKNDSAGGLDDYGFPVEPVMTDVTTLWCKVKKMSVKEAVKENTFFNVGSITFIIPKFDFDNGMFINYNGEDWSITEMQSFDTFHIVITAEKRNPNIF